MIKKHLSGEFSDQFNDAMIKRLETAFNNNKKISGAELDFYCYEIYEVMLMEKGMMYEEAHSTAMAYYNAVEYNFYHPEVILEYPKFFNKGWFEFWGIE